MHCYTHPTLLAGVTSDLLHLSPPGSFMFCHSPMPVGTTGWVYLVGGPEQELFGAQRWDLVVIIDSYH